MMLTEDDVIWCYRAILGRPPESAAVVQSHVSSGKTFRTLVWTFLKSQEYRSKTSVPAFVPLDREEMDMDITASSTDMRLLIDRVRNAWTHLGQVRPHYSVLTNRKYLPESLDAASIEDFYSSGVGEVSAIAAILRRFGKPEVGSQVCVEYGCGLGRVTVPLAKKFKSVHAYDISGNHLALARKRAFDAGVHNIEFHLCSAKVVIENLERCDVLYSRIVYQHNPPPIIRELIGAALRSLRPGGIAIFQVPTYWGGYSFRIKEYLAQPAALDLEMHCIPQGVVLSIIAESHCKLLEIREDGSTGHSQAISNTFVVQRLAGRSRPWRWASDVAVAAHRIYQHFRRTVFTRRRKNAAISS
ncbi:MAG TPA: class I SAM-dependent methyltransferase [Steroidobacteraceae bacterium]|nr:class I SAM-dependent methyltransferase [Steroidobacteraceae bacterium]